MARIDFWYEFASTYSYLSAMRIEDLAAARAVTVRWRPFLLGPIFRDQGWTTSPFNIYPAKGAYMMRDIERIAAVRGLRFRLPEPFPVNGLYAARLALVGADEGWTPAFTRAVYLAEFRDGRDIADAKVLEEILTEIGCDARACLERASLAEIKDALKSQTAQAQAIGLFGAPSFVTAEGEIFWGDDRLEQAIDWAVRTEQASGS